MHTGNIFYIWVGSSFKLDASQAQLDSDRQSDFLGAVDWNRIGCDLLAQFDLPKDTVTKVYYLTPLLSHHTIINLNQS
jgi:hypothetical protein